MISENALFNGDWTRTFPSARSALDGYSWLLVAFDLDTVKLLMNLFVSIWIFFSKRVIYVLVPARTQTGPEALISTR